MTIIKIESNELPVHGSPQDRGSADRYYGRQYNPHYWPSGTGKGIRIDREQMTEEQIAEYTYGWDTELERKDWG